MLTPPQNHLLHNLVPHHKHLHQQRQHTHNHNLIAIRRPHLDIDTIRHSYLDIDATRHPHNGGRGAEFENCKHGRGADFGGCHG